MQEHITLPASFAREEDRVRAAYARRDGAGRDARYTWASPSHVFQSQERERHVLRLLRREGCLPLTGKTLLDVGCGNGTWLREFIKWGAQPHDLTGVDLLPARVEQAVQLCPADTRIDCGSATDLPFPNDSFDIVLQATMFTSILDPTVRERIAAEMRRVVKPDGFILWFDFHMNNPWNPDVRGVPKAEIQRLFPGCRVQLRRTVLAAPLSRRTAPVSWLLSYVLARFAPLCTHYLGTIRKGSD